MSSSNPIDLADHDLAALQEARDLLGRARQAAATLALRPKGASLRRWARRLIWTAERLVNIGASFRRS